MKRQMIVLSTRVPKELKRAVIRAARKEKVTPSAYVAKVLKEAIEGENK